MRAGLGLAPLILLSLLASATAASAQTVLPPPPPPPIDNSGGSGSSGSGSGTTDNTATTHKPKPKKPTEPAHTATPTPPPPPAHHEEPRSAIEPETPRDTSIRFNPLPFFLSRLSADLEFMLAPHHALVVSPSATFRSYAFHRGENFAYGMGFADDNAGGLGGEVGYHYWVHRHLQGIYLGPSGLLGVTFPGVGNSFGYYGAAFDVGYQVVFSNGFTLNGGGGLLIDKPTVSGSLVRVEPRLLFGVGWSF